MGGPIDYELFKQGLERLELTPEEYERRVQDWCDKCEY